MTRRVLPVALLLFLSGLCALVYQVTWQREFHLVFGGSTAASGAVLAIFMGGLGLGNAWLGRRVDTQPRPLAFYARLELMIAASAALSLPLMALVRSLYFAMGGQTALGLAGATALRLGLSTLVLAVPTVLMGGTLPAAARAATTAADTNRRGLGVLYGVNTLGAVLGAVLSTFYLLETFGMRRTLGLACAVNVAVAALAAWMASHLPGHTSERSAAVLPGESCHPERSEGSPSTSGQILRCAQDDRQGAQDDRCANPEVILRPSPRSFLYFAAAVAGFAFFLMELVWFRMLGPLLGGTTFTFGLILAVALSGIGLGGASYPLLFRRGRPTLLALAITCGLEALTIALPYALGDRLALLAAVYREASASFLGLVGGWTIVAAIVVFPAAVVSGVQFPLLVALLGEADEAVGRQVGTAFAWNTLGAIAGSLAGGFGILPWLGAPGTWCAVVALLCGLGLLAAIFFGRARRTPAESGATGGLSAREAAALLDKPAVAPLARASLAILFGTVVWIPFLLCLLAVGPTAVWRHSGIGAGRSVLPPSSPNAQRAWIHERRRAVVWEAEGVESSVALADLNGYAFIVNGKSDGNAIGDAATQIGPALVGGILHPHPTSALVVGLGTGETAGSLAEIPSIERVDVVELEPAIDKVAEVCAAVNGHVLQHPKVRRLYNDGREVLLTATGSYDLIVSEPSNPYRAGVATLYTREYYQAVLARLGEDGLFLQWFQAYEVDAASVRIVLATLGSVFQHVELWQTRSRDMLLVCSRRAFGYPAARQRKRLSEEPFRSALRVAWRATDLEGFLAHYLGGPALVRDFCNTRPASGESGWAGSTSPPLNCDDRNLLEYGVARTVGRRGGFQVEALRARAVAISAGRPPVSDGTVDWQRVESYRLSMHAVSSGVVPLSDYLSDDSRARGRFLMCYLAGQMREAVAAWNSRPRQPACPTEVTALAHAYAELGDPRARAWADRAGEFSPTEADAVMAILQWRQGHAAAAADSIETTLNELRKDPWPLQPLIGALLDVAVEVCAANPQRAGAVFDALQQPFAVAAFQDKRRLTSYLVARRIGAAETARSLQPFEPNVPWKESLLAKRAEVYTALGDPRAARARADLRQYRRQAP